MTLLAAGLILMISFIIGASIYSFGIWTGLIKSQTLTSILFEALTEKPELAVQIADELNKKTCVNTDINFRIDYQPQWRETVENPEEPACTRFVWVDDKTIQVKINRSHGSKDEVLGQTLQKLSEIQTNSFDHPNYPAVLIQGILDKRTYLGVLITTKNDENFLLSLSNAEALDFQPFRQLVKGFVKN